MAASKSQKNEKLHSEVDAKNQKKVGAKNSAAQSKTKAAKQKTAKQKSTKQKTSKKADAQKPAEKKVEYFGHKPEQNIWESFLVNTMFAHRGMHNDKLPENSLGAFAHAIEHGYGIELDVNPIEDGTPVVFHDSKMSRMTTRDKYIQNLSREEFETTTLLSTTEKIPTLKEVLDFVDGRVPLLIEIKHQQKVGDLEKQVWELLKNYKGEYAIQSFDPYSLIWFANNAPKVWRGQLASYFKGEDMGFLKKSLLKRLAFKNQTQHDFVSYKLADLPNRFTKKLEVPLLTWVVKSKENYIKALKITDNIIFEGFEPTI